MSAQNPTDEEKAVRAETWAENLFDLIPENRLDDTFRRAFKDHTSDFPVSAYDLKNAWQKMKVEEFQSREQPVGGEPASAELCEKCYGTGMSAVYDETGYRIGVKPGCDHVS
jgi:hypothetical protein